MTKKLNSEGKYLTFPGITVVSAIKEADKPLWQLIYEALNKNKEFTDHFTPLPYESYHLTAINLYTKDAIGSGKWRDFIISNSAFFQSLNGLLAEKSFSPVVSIESINIAGALQIMVTLPEEQIKIIQEVAKTHHVEARIPAVFHITLAYQFKYVEHEVLEKLELELRQEIFSILKSHEGELSLTPPGLCFFNNMTKFIPWSGGGYPFPKSILGSNTLFSREEAPKKGMPSPLIGCTVI